ncbi:MAG: M23 family metallopeptidase [Anaerolineae bacterium]|nr:M23 family metallopeptidase [Anaerolineae bacterium]
MQTQQFMRLLGFSILILCVTILIGCSQETASQPDVTPVIVLPTPLPATPTRIPTASPTVTPTPTMTPTPSPTPTPTPTAMPLTVSGNPRSAQLATPEYNSTFPCGVVDVFDFPLDPPDAASLSGGSDFGIFRSRYDKYHAGEDWWYGRGSSFGKPVYAVGHGLVTYAQPEGWGRDKGVIIVQHSYNDGSQVLSFYGHLDPPSVTLTAGECVQRGDKIAEIGRPRTSPHLHFEMRTQSPWAPLTGYWEEDPTTVGWLAPSQTIWEQRIITQPGVQWTRAFTTTETRTVGVLSDNEFAVIEGNQLRAVDLADGSDRVLLPEMESVRAALVHDKPHLMVVADRYGQISAFSLPLENTTSAWTADLGKSGVPNLLPLADGGVLAVWRTEMAAFSAEGDLLWRQMGEWRLLDWILHDDTLFLSTVTDGGTVWALRGADRPEIVAAIGGKLAAAGDVLWVYAMEGVYRWQDGVDSAEMIKALPTGSIQRGDIIALPDNGILLAHADSRDQRLLAFHEDGSLFWERSYAGLVDGDVSLTIVGGAPYVIANANSGSSGELKVYAVDRQTAALRHIFTGGTRSPRPGQSWAQVVNGSDLLLNIGGGPLAFFTPPE